LHWHRDRISSNLGEHHDCSPLQEELTKRRIPIQSWGRYASMGLPTTRILQHEGSLSAKNSVKPPPDLEIWGKIWNLRHWPKITLFLWLVSHSSILTWDNLLKRGFVGPSLCILCGEAEETMNHLLNTCPLHSPALGSGSSHHAHFRSDRDCIRATITNWRDQAFHSPILNRIWQLLPGFILWQTWKERNRRIFRNTSLTWQQCWSFCYRNIIETLHLRNWSEADSACSPSELTILRHWTPLPAPQAGPPSPSPANPIREAPPSGPHLLKTLLSSISMGPLIPGWGVKRAIVAGDG
jgi:hypothetical protein